MIKQIDNQAFDEMTVQVATDSNVWYAEMHWIKRYYPMVYDSAKLAFALGEVQAVMPMRLVINFI